MAVNNRISNGATRGKRLGDDANGKVVEYKCGEEIVKLSPSIIRQYLVSGDGEVTDQEVVMFLNLCRFQHLNPFLREAYLIKFRNRPATIVVGKDAIAKRAMRNPGFEGHQAGVVVQDEDGMVEYRNGALILQGETIVGGWAKVYVKGYQHPVESVVSFGEYAGLKNDGSMNQQWSRKPATMIRKVALVQAMREAFPEDLEGMYDSSEMGVEFDENPSLPPAPDGGQPQRFARAETIDSAQGAQTDEEPATLEELPGEF